jgi:bile acid:Na+ symporter, BASS family
VEEPGLAVQIALPVALAVIMTCLGLSLQLSDFTRVVRYPRGVAIGLANLIVLSPLLAFGIAELYGLAAVLAVGLVLMGAAPGGTMANLLTHLAKGDTALSVSMTAISSVLAVVTVPLYLGLATSHFDLGLDEDPQMLPIVARVFTITVVPLALGMWLRARNPDRVGEWLPKAKKISLIVFVLVVVVAVGSEFGEVRDSIDEVALATLTLNVAAMTLSFVIARVAGLDLRQTTAISLELGLHNSTLAIAVATGVDSELAIPAAVYSAFMWVTAGFFVRTMQRRNASFAPEPEPVAA